MKTLYYIFLFLSFNLATGLNLLAQSPIDFENDVHFHKKELNDTLALKKFNYDRFINEVSANFKKRGYEYNTDKCLQNFLVTYQISLFNEIFEAYQDDKSALVYKNIATSFLTKYNSGLDMFIQNEQLLRSEYQRVVNSGNVAPSGNRLIAPNTQAGCTNMDFEAGNISGWTSTSSNGKVASTATSGQDNLVPAISRTYSIGVIPPASPNVGTSALLDAINGVSNEWLQLSQNFTVSNLNANFLFYVAIITANAGHACGQNPRFQVSITNSSGATIPCSSISLEGVGSAGACSAYTGWTNTGGYTYLNWTPIMVPLQAYMGQNVTISLRVTRCAQGGHGLKAYLESSCDPKGILGSNNVVCPGKPVRLYAPNLVGFNYNWTSSTGFTATTPSVSITQAGTYSVTITNAINGCQMKLDTAITAVASPTANFNYTVTPCITTYSVPVLSTSLPAAGDPISSYQWIWGDLTANGSGVNNAHTYATVGAKSIELKIQSNAGCRDSITQSFNIIPKPTANFSAMNICQSSVSTFTNSSLAPAPAAFASQIWNWGDGSANGFGSSPTHTYVSAGTYNVKLVITNTSLCKDSMVRPITIYPKPVISFNAPSVCFGVVTNFMNNTTILAPDNIAAWSWDFDNNGTTDNTTQSPSLTFTSSGTKAVELKATTNNGCRDSSVVNILVNATPTATFTPVNACLNSNVVLNNTSSIPAPDNIVLYTWNFGSNSAPAGSSNQNPPSLSYNLSGNKTISLVIMANTSCTAAITQTVEVYPEPIANFSTTSVCQSTATVFADLSTISSGTISSWTWDYTNDGVTDNNIQNPSYTYPQSATYRASLQVKSDRNCVNSYTMDVNVWGHSIPDFTPDNVCYGTVNIFNNLTNVSTNGNIGGMAGYSWDFADATPVDNSVTPLHTYVLGGNVNATYNVTLTATTNHNCVDQKVKLVTVYALPTASFTSNQVCLGTASQMTDASAGNGNTITDYSWDFLNDGTVDVNGISNPNYTFPAFGDNPVSYTVTSTPVVGLTCFNVNSTIPVWVNPNPIAKFNVINKCINDQPVGFDASVSLIAVGTNTAYAWIYGDATTGTGIITTHAYALAAIYNVSLKVTSDKGCETISAKTAEVYQKPFVSISNSNACDTKPMSFNVVSLPNSGNVTHWFWDFNNTITSIETDGQATSNIFPVAGNNTVMLVSETDNGCRDTLSKVVYVDYVPKPLFSVDNPRGCSLPHCVVFTDNTAPLTGPATNNTWKWVFGDGTVVNSTSNVNQAKCYTNNSSSQSAFYDVRLVVTTTQGCTDSLEQTSFIEVYPKPLAQYQANPNPGNVVTPLVYFTNQSLGYTKWWWNFGDSQIRDSINVDPTHFYESVTASNYNTYLIVSNSYGCLDTAYLRLEIGPEFTFYIPNAFTPGNEDGVNEVFTGKGIGIEKYEMWVFDRWGSNIFYANDIFKGWDGTVQGKSEQCKQDVYVWKVKITDIFGKKHDYIGHVTLLR